MKFKQLVRSALAVISLFAGIASADPLGYPNQVLRSASNATTTLKTGVGMLALITVGVPGTTSTIICYDNTAASGTVILNANTLAVGTLFYNTAFAIGLTCTTAGAAAADLSISYK